MIRILLLIGLPIYAYAEEKNLSLNSGGVFFMIFAWSAIIIWNTVCFTKLLSKKK